MKRTIGTMLIVGALALAGCGTESTDEADSTTTTEAAEETTTTEAPTTTTAPPTTTEAPTTTTAAPPTTEAPAALMPDVVCMNLQEAQDYIQAETGVFYSRSEDATGQGRMQVMDSNWIVVDQTPPPGTPIGEGDAVLSVVKEDEPNNC